MSRKLIGGLIQCAEAVHAVVAVALLVALTADARAQGDAGPARTYQPCLEHYPVRLHADGFTIEPITTRVDSAGIHYVLANPYAGPKEASGFLGWSELHGVDVWRPRTSFLPSGFDRGAFIGFAVGVAIVLAYSEPSDDHPYIYPFTVAFLALPFALVGGGIGSMRDHHSKALPAESGRWAPCPSRASTGVSRKPIASALSQTAGTGGVCPSTH